MYMERTCQTCGTVFEGGPRAYYCPSCRKERQQEANRRSKQAARRGTNRPIGSSDICMQCGQPYTVNSGLQRYCPVCAEVRRIEHDRQRALLRYNAYRDIINPQRYAKRRKPPQRCAWCGKEYKAPSRTKTCSPECTRLHYNKRMATYRRAMRQQKKRRP